MDKICIWTEIDINHFSIIPWLVSGPKLLFFLRGSSYFFIFLGGGGSLKFRQKKSSFSGRSTSGGTFFWLPLKNLIDKNLEFIK